MYFTRYITPILLERLRTTPVVAITGPRQAGKTTLAKAILLQVAKKAIYLDLELPSDLNRLFNPELFLQEHEAELVVIDEVQRKPEIFPLLRALVDKRREPARFLILGSASPELLRQSSETLAGRISYLELTPFHFQELPQGFERLHWLRGGFPPALLARNDDAAFQWIEDFVQTFIERDLPQFGLNAPAQTLRNLLLMLTGVHGNMINHSNIANSLGLTVPTIKRYTDYIEHAYFVRYLSPWFVNVSKRLVKTPKLYFRDTGVLHYLAGIYSKDQLLGNQLAGASWEGYVVQQILSALPSRVSPYFYRSKDGAEVDLVLVKGSQPYLTVEVKLSEKPALSKGYRNAIGDVNAPMNIIVTPMEGDYPIEDKIRVCGMANVGKYIE